MQGFRGWREVITGGVVNDDWTCVSMICDYRAHSSSDRKWGGGLEMCRGPSARRPHWLMVSWLL